jgi:hypothetical protein
MHPELNVPYIMQMIEEYKHLYAQSMFDSYGPDIRKRNERLAALKRSIVNAVTICPERIRHTCPQHGEDCQHAKG